MTGQGSVVRRRTVGLVAVTATVAATFLIDPVPAAAATTLTVSTTTDVSAGTGACGNSGITTPPSPLSLREATCLANNIGGAVSINLPAGTYNLANGELTPGIHSGQAVTIIGAGSASTVVSGQNLSRVFDIDPSSVGGVTANLSGMTVTNGKATSFGGGGILAGSGNATTSDTITLDSMVVTNSQANVSTPNSTGQPGGGMQMGGGELTITNTTFANNGAQSSQGSGLFFYATGTSAAQGVSISNSVFSGNTATNTNGTPGVPNGGALAIQGVTGNNSVTNTRFVNNSVTATTGQAVGAGIWSQGGTLSVTGSSFTGNSVSGGQTTAAGGAIYTAGTTLTAHYNRFTGNIAPSGSAVAQASGAVDATENWWGCNAGPGGTGCDTVSGIATVSPRLVLTAAASPATVVGPNATSTVTASLTSDSLGGPVGGANLGAFAALLVTFSDPPGDAIVGASVGAKTVAIGSGQASIDYHSNTTFGSDPVNATLDNATVTANITVNEAPAITSANTAHFNVGSAGSFTVTTIGVPSPAISRTGTLPSGLTFTDNGNGTATLSGTAAGPGGTYPLNLTASNGVGPNATQTLTVTVGQPPAFTNPSTATFTTGSAGSFTVTTTGIPTVTAITESGTLPSGLTFTDNGNGTATLAGTPAAGSGGTYPVSLGATNGVAPNATQALSIQVNQAPAVTGNPSDQTVNPGTSVTFTAAATGAPTPTVQWQRSTDGGAGFTNVAGANSTSYTFTTVAGDNGNLYRAVFTNVVSSATTTAATLNVGSAPAFTSADHTTFSVGTGGTFAITTAGVPNATLSRTGTFPAWLTLTDNGDGTGSLTGTPPAGSGGTYTFTLKAANGFSPSASQAFTLSVDETPSITSTNHATFTVGSAGSFAVTTTAGYPVTTTITETGALPSGVSFHDNGDGTATLSGIAAAGAAGSYPLTITATATGGVTAPATQSFTLTVNGPPTITSSNHATFSVGVAGSFTVTTSAGFPAASTLTEAGTLPGGVSFTDNGNGTATLAGTPAFNTGSVYPITIKVSNGIAPDATQSFTLTVNQPPTITSADHATFTVGAAAGFTVTTAAGQPTTTVLTETGTLPAGVGFTDNGDGTASLAGTPTVGGVFAFTVMASNGVAPDATQAFTLTVNQPSTITSDDHTTFTVGSAGTFTVTTTAGTPAARTITETGTLPSGISFTDNGDGTATLAGTPAAGQGGAYSLTIKASNGVAPVPSQSFTLTVNETSAITSADHATFTLGSPGSFTVTTASGFPTPPVLTETGTLPPGMSFTDNGDGTATLSGTPAASSSGTYPLTLTATNSAGHLDQAFTLTVVKRAQTITLTSTPPSPAAVGGTYTPTATSDSGLAVTFTVDAATTSNSCTLSGSTVSFVHSGTCVIDANQAGDATYAAADQVQQTITVMTVSTGLGLVTSLSPSVYGQAIHATATVSAASGSPAGSVQFSVDGSDLGVPVTVATGSATSPPLTDATGHPLAPGSHQIGATFTPDDAITYASAQNTTTQVVDRAATTTTLAVHAHTLTATVTAKSPGVGIPSGTVTFSVGGHPVGTRALTGGVATLTLTVPTRATRTVGALYSGDTGFSPSSVSTSRHDPRITAVVTSAHGRTRYGWYRSRVTIRFHCVTAGAPLTTPCPAAVTLTRNGAGQSITRTISATDGGMSTVSVGAINIDMIAPTVRVTGIRNGAVYNGTAPPARCVAADALSGLAACTLTRHTTGGTTRYRATATDKAGNTRSVVGSYRTDQIYLQGAARSGNVFTVNVRRTYTLVVTGMTTRPYYYDATHYPQTPNRRDKAFRAAGYQRWALGITMTPSLRNHRYWNLGVKIGTTMHVITIRIA